jgi:hypothetical protein
MVLKQLLGYGGAEMGIRRTIFRIVLLCVNGIRALLGSGSLLLAHSMRMDSAT